MTIARYGGGVLVAFLVFGPTTATLAAQTPAPPQKPDNRPAPEAVLPPRGPRTLLVDVGFGGPTQATIGLGLVVPVGRYEPIHDFLEEFSGLEVKASTGTDGARLAVGRAIFDKHEDESVIFVHDVLVGVTRTWKSARGASPDSTYVGVEGGLMFVCMRVTAGLAHRVAGPAGPKGTIFTWTVGMQTGW